LQRPLSYQPSLPPFVRLNRTIKVVFVVITALPTLRNFLLTEGRKKWVRDAAERRLTG
jgi:hypothetical protein